MLGKPVAVLGVILAGDAGSATAGCVRRSAGARSAAGGTIAGVGFTVSLLIATLAFTGDQLEEAKIGILGAVVCAFALTWAVTAVIGLLPRRTQIRALLGTTGGHRRPGRAGRRRTRPHPRPRWTHR